MAVRMFLRSMVFALVFSVVMQPAVYAQQDESAAQSDGSSVDNSLAIKAQLWKIGKGAPVIVAFEDGTAQAGRIKKLGESNFALSEGDKGTASYVYSSVSSVSQPQGATSNLGSKVVPIAFVGVALVAVAGMVGFALTKSRTNPSSAAAIPAK